MAATNIIFDGVSLQTANILTQSIDHYSIGTKTLNAQPLAHGNKSVIPFIDYQSKNIVISGIIIDNTIAAVDSRLDTFRGLFNGQDKNLDIDYGTGARRYIATAADIKITRPGGLLWATFEISFFCIHPFGFDTAVTTLINDVAITAVTYAPTCTFAGSAPIQRPIITLTYGALTGNTGTQIVVISNNATGQNISISRTWASNDVIVIDTFNRSVKVNGFDINFSGAFPEFKPGAGGFGYTDPFTTRSFGFKVDVTAAWL